MEYKQYNDEKKTRDWESSLRELFIMMEGSWLTAADRKPFMIFRKTKLPE